MDGWKSCRKEGKRTFYNEYCSRHRCPPCMRSWCLNHGYYVCLGSMIGGQWSSRLERPSLLLVCRTRSVWNEGEEHEEHLAITQGSTRRNTHFQWVYWAWGPVENFTFLWVHSNEISNQARNAWTSIKWNEFIVVFRVVNVRTIIAGGSERERGIEGEVFFLGCE